MSQRLEGGGSLEPVTVMETEATTELELEPFKFLWTVKCFSTLCGTAEVTSPVFHGGAKSNHSWNLKICPKKMIDGTEYFSVHLVLSKFGDGNTSSDRNIKVRFEISLLKRDGRPGNTKGSETMNPFEFRTLTKRGYDKFIPFSELESFVVNDILGISCLVWIEGDLKHTVNVKQGLEESSIPAEERSRIQKDNLAKDFGKLLRESVGDIMVTARGGQQTYRAHKAILAARSSVFKAMFNTERNQNELNIEDFDENVVKGMLEFIYTGETESMRMRGLPLDLLMIADKYDIKVLKDECEREIAEYYLSVDQAAAVLVLAQMYGAPMLKQRAADIISRNKEAVKKTETFKRFSETHPKILIEAFLSLL